MPADPHNILRLAAAKGDRHVRDARAGPISLPLTMYKMTFFYMSTHALQVSPVPKVFNIL